MKPDSADSIDSGFDLPPPAAAPAERVDLQAFGRMMEAELAPPVTEGKGISPSARAMAVPLDLTMAFAVVAKAAKGGTCATLSPAQAVALADWQRRAWQETHTPYQVFWRDRAQAAEAELHRRAAAARSGGGVGIYVASKVSHASLWRGYRVHRYPIISTWIDEAGEGETADYKELAPRCVAEVQAAAAVVLYCNPGETLKGALIEVGAALAFGKPVFCAGTCESISRVFREHPLWYQRHSLTGAMDAARFHIASSASAPSASPR